MTKTNRILPFLSISFLLVACGENFEDAGDGFGDEACDTGMSGDAEAGDADAGDAGDADRGRCDGGDGDDDGRTDGDGGDGDGDGHTDGGCDDGRGCQHDDGSDGHDDGGEADAGEADAGDTCDGGAETDGGVETGSPACEPTDLALIAGQNYDAGSVTVSIIDGDLLVEVEAVDPWALEMVHVYAGLEAPANNPGSYPIAADLDHADHYGVVIPMDSIPAQCGDVIFVAVHAEVVDQNSLQGQTAWASGDKLFDMGWGSYFEVSICC